MHSQYLLELLYLKESKSFLDRVSTGSGSDLVNVGSQQSKEISMVIADQVAIAPCTDPAQADVRLLRQSLTAIERQITPTLARPLVSGQREFPQC